MTTSIIGVDVSKSSLDSYDLATGKSQHISGQKMPDWIASLSSREDDVLVVFEATGVYSRKLISALSLAQIPFAQLNPRQVRRHAQARGILAKTDKVDARVIADFARIYEVKPAWYCASAQDEELRAAVVRRNQLNMVITAEINHLESTLDKRICKAISKHISALKKELVMYDAQIEMLLKKDERAAILQSIPGIGNIVTATILSHMPEIGALNREQIAALAGLAPYNRDSGTLRGKRTIYGGRTVVRKALYMAALVAIRHNKSLKHQYDRLIKNGKAFKCAITAIMRKLLIIANTMIKNKQTWTDKYSEI